MKAILLENCPADANIVHAVEKMIYLCCGEDLETATETRAIQIAENKFHILYKEYNQYEGMDFKVKVEPLPPLGLTYRFTIYDSVYADDGTFEL